MYIAQIDDRAGPTAVLRRENHRVGHRCAAPAPAAVRVGARPRGSKSTLSRSRTCTLSAGVLCLGVAQRPTHPGRTHHTVYGQQPAMNVGARLSSNRLSRPALFGCVRASSM